MMPAGCEPRCPGCAFRDLSYGESLRRKQEWVEAKLRAFAPPGTPATVETIRSRQGSGLGYRKSVFLRTELRSGAWIAGTLKKAFRDEEIISIPGCPVHRPGLNAALLRALRLLDAMPALPLFGVLIRGDLLSLVVKSARTSPIDEALRALDWSSTGFRGVFANFHASAGNRVLHAKGWSHLWGERWGAVEMEQGAFRHGPSAFLQQLPSLHDESIRLADEFFFHDGTGASPVEGVLDLYCGIGVSLARWKSRGIPVLGVESAGEAVECAGAFADVLVGRVEQRLPQLRSWAGAKSSVAAYVNPSRLGLEPAVAAWLAEEEKIRRLAYLSCSPGTLARDLKLLQSGGFVIERLVPFDFLPFTSAIEVLALAAR